MAHLLLWGKGYVTISIRSNYPERFINLCANHNINLWDIHKDGDGYVMKVTIAGFFRLKPVIRKTGTKLRILDKKGLRIWLNQYRKRKLFGVGILLCAFYLLFMSERLWNIELSGNSSITYENMIPYMKSKGIHYGMRVKDIDVELLEESIRDSYNNVTWVSVKNTGTTLLVQIKENSDTNFIGQTNVNNQTNLNEQSDINFATNLRNPVDLVADRDGTIISMVVRTGVPNVKIGDNIAKGDILVSGTIPMALEEELTLVEVPYLYVVADADIYVQSEETYNDKILNSYQKKNYTGRFYRNLSFVLYEKKFQIPLPDKGYEKSDTLNDFHKICLFNQVELPFEYGFCTIKEYQLTTEKYKEEELKDILEKRFDEYLIKLDEKGVQILEKDVKIVSGYNTTSLRSNLTIIGKVQKGDF